MLALELDKQTVKTFMGQLLRSDIFDAFDVRSVDITTHVRINIDGLQDAEEDKKPTFAAWESVRPLVYENIKASQKPKLVKIVFSYNAQTAQEIHPNAAALFLNLAYENDSVTFTTGTAQREFLFEKSLDTNWDEWVRDFFAKVGLEVADRE